VLDGGVYQTAVAWTPTWSCRGPQGARFHPMVPRDHFLEISDRFGCTPGPIVPGGMISLMSGVGAVTWVIADDGLARVGVVLRMC
jgi:hypothetical protein